MNFLSRYHRYFIGNGSNKAGSIPPLNPPWFVGFIGIILACLTSAAVASGAYQEINFNNGGSYHGFMDRGIRTGFGVYRYHNGQIYEGEWRANRRDGFGVMRWPSGNRFFGGWRNGRQHGVGLLIWADGGIFRGIWENGQAVIDPQSKQFVAHLMRRLNDPRTLETPEFENQLRNIVANRNDPVALEYFIGTSTIGGSTPPYLDLLGEYVRSNGSIDVNGLRRDMARVASQTKELNLPKVNVDEVATLRAKAMIALQDNGLAVIERVNALSDVVIIPSAALNEITLSANGITRTLRNNDDLVQQIARALTELNPGAEATIVPSPIYRLSVRDLAG